MSAEEERIETPSETAGGSSDTSSRPVQNQSGLAGPPQTPSDQIAVARGPSQTAAAGSDNPASGEESVDRSSGSQPPRSEEDDSEEDD
ncbi:hypothetical protein ACFL5O_10060, partial [Myxococcota bacterium]